MARVDDFIQARAIAGEELSGRDVDSIPRFSGALMNTDVNGAKTFSIRFLNRDIIMSWPELEFSFSGSDNEEVPVQHQAFLLHYINGTCNSGKEKNTGRWISFQDLPDGRFYMDPFIKRAKEPLLKAFETKPEKMPELASGIYDASPMEFGDFSTAIRALPRVPVVLVLWKGDDEFPAESNILFDSDISEILSAEDIAWLAGMVVYPLVGMVKHK
jgi:hypothetical protein